MSQHPSLKASKTGKKLRTVLKRYERFFKLKDKGVLQDGSSVFGMPKLKIVRTKIKKEKAAEKPEEAGAVAQEGAAPGGAAKETAPKADPGKGAKKEKKK
ncbi:MAG: small basic protein [Candidatus Omnitrophica bacterium]|nr:small basic protein [Candidatus Omnitrophota bacterium]MBU4457698.1 small basic protein [Candidatus Omnitrophota bacterium]